MAQKRQLLIDADFVLFRDCSAVEREAVWENEAGHKVHILSSCREEALDTFRQSVDGFLDRLGADEAILVFSGAAGLNFRLGVDPTYKGNRKGSRKPLCYYDVIADLRASGEYPVVSQDGLEGDDYIGILATRPSSAQRIIVSDDKDMQTLPNVTICRMGNLVSTSQESADRYWLMQALIGDTTDGYKGCPGVGAVAAESILDGQGFELRKKVLKSGPRKGLEVDEYARVPMPTVWDAVVSAFIANGLTAEDALTQARLARILRHTDWDGEARRPILWTPNDPTAPPA
jgi:5'-3' exonuclease